MMKKITFFWFLILITSFSASAKEVFIEPSNNSHEEVQTALIELSPGDVLTLSPGTFVFEDGLSLDVDEVIVRGSGMDETILDFKNQMSGAQGLLVTSDRVTLKDFAVTDAKGDAIKVIGAEGINMINLKTEWTGGPKSTNGAYGLYPVESSEIGRAHV